MTIQKTLMFEKNIKLKAGWKVWVEYKNSKLHKVIATRTNIMGDDVSTYIFFPGDIDNVEGSDDLMGLEVEAEIKKLLIE